MKLLLFVLFCFLLFIDPASSDPPIPFEGFTVRALDPTSDLLSGMIWTEDGLVVCDRRAGTLLRIQHDGTTGVLLDQLITPVDVMEYGNEWLILQESEGSLIGVDKSTLQRRIVADGFNYPTAFTIDDRNMAYVTEFYKGVLLQVNLQIGEVEKIWIGFDRPADVLFVEPDFLYVADQVGADLQDGAVYKFHRDGKLFNIEKGIIDPTGLALSSAGEVYVSTFSIPDSSPDNRMGRFNGGVVRLRGDDPPESIVSGLFGPTSIVFDGGGNLIVLEEPSDSIYRYTLASERTPIVEGFLPIEQAGRNNDGDIFAIEMAPFHQLKILPEESSMYSWDYSLQGPMDRVKLSVDGEGYVYLAEPLSSKIHVYDQMGNPIHTYDNIVPFFMAGIPTGGIIVLTMASNSLIVSLLNPSGNQKTFSLDLDGMFTTGFAKSEDQVIVSLTNGEIQELDFNTREKRTIIPSTQGTAYLSSAMDRKRKNAFWLFDTNHQILFWNGEELIPAAQTVESGILLPDPNGVIFLGNSGKRFLLFNDDTAISNWRLF